MTVLGDFAYQIMVYRLARDRLACAMQLVLAETNKVEKSNKPRQATDADLFKVLKNTISGLKEVLIYSTGDVTYEKNQVELFEKYLSHMMSDGALGLVIAAIMSDKGVEASDGMRSMGIIMGELKRLHPGEYDSKLASAVIRNILS